MTLSALAEVSLIYTGSDGEATRTLYQRLEPLGPIGIVATNLFRAVKSSMRAKDYRGGRHRRAAYDRKGWAMDNLCAVLAEHAHAAGVVAWGWQVDQAQAFHRHVLYIDLPTGQVSFHTAERGAGPDYPGAWDGSKASPERIVRFVAQVIDGRAGSVRPFLADRLRHLVRLPYTIEGLHAMAAELAIARGWFHAGRWPHYDIPLRRLPEILARPDVEVVTPRELLTRIKADQVRRSAPPAAAMPTEQLGLL